MQVNSMMAYMPSFGAKLKKTPDAVEFVNSMSSSQRTTFRESLFFTDIAGAEDDVLILKKAAPKNENGGFLNKVKNIFNKLFCINQDEYILYNEKKGEKIFVPIKSSFSVSAADDFNQKLRNINKPWAQPLFTKPNSSGVKDEKTEPIEQKNEGDFFNGIIYDKSEDGKPVFYSFFGKKPNDVLNISIYDLSNPRKGCKSLDVVLDDPYKYSTEMKKQILENVAQKEKIAMLKEWDDSKDWKTGKEQVCVKGEDVLDGIIKSAGNVAGKVIKGALMYKIIKKIVS